VTKKHPVADATFEKTRTTEWR